MKKNHFNIIISILLLAAAALTLSCDGSGTLDPVSDTDTLNLVLSNLISTKDKVGIYGEKAGLNITVSDQDGDPVEGVVFGFFAVHGSVTETDTTDTGGIATATYISGDTTAVDTVSAVVLNYGSGSLIRSVNISVEQKNIISVSVYKDSMISDGADTSSVLVNYTDYNGMPIRDKVISLYTDYGTVSGPVTTDIAGNATALYTAPPGYADSTANIIAYESGTTLKVSGTGEKSSKPEDSSKSNSSKLTKIAAIEEFSSSDTASVELTGITFSLTINPDSLSISETTPAIVTALLKTTGDSMLVSRELSFTTNFGELVDDTAVTGYDGTASVRILPAQTTGVATVTALTSSGLTATALVQFFSSGGQEANIQLSSNPTEISADGSSTSQISVIITDSRNNPVDGATVNFSTDLGRIDANSITDNTGSATATFYAGRTNGTATITAQYGDFVKTTQVQISGSQIRLLVDPVSIVADGISKAAVRATVTDAAEMPIESAEITLETTQGTFENGETTITGLTNVNGIFIDSLKGGDSGTAVITAEGAGAENSAELLFSYFITELEPDDSVFTAGSDSIGLTFRLLDRFRVGQPDKRVIFGTTLGTLTIIEGYTDTNGEVRTLLKSPFAGSATVSAKVSLDDETVLVKNTDVTVLSAVPDSIVIIADPVVVEVNGGTSTIRAFVTDESGNPVSGQTVTFSLLQPLGGGESIDPVSVITDNTGTALTTFTSGFLASKVQNDVIVKAVIQDYLLENQTSLTVAGEPHIMTTEANPPPTQNEDGSFSLDIISILSDINGNPVVDGTTVYFSAQPPEIGTITTDVQTTNGVAVATLTYQSAAAGKAITIVSTSGSVTETLNIDQLPGFVDDVIIVGPSKSDIIANGNTSSTFSVRVVDASDNPIQGVDVSFESNPGNSSSDISQDQLLSDGITQNPSWGVAQFNYIGVASEEDYYPEIIVTVGGITDTFQTGNVRDLSNPLLVKGLSITATSSLSSLSAGETAEIYVTLKETTSFQAVTGEEVTFGSKLGIIEKSGETDETGRLVMTYTAGQTAGEDQIIVSAGVSDTLSITIFESAAYGEPANIYLSADTTYIMVEDSPGRRSTPVTALVTDAANKAVEPGTEIRLTTNLGVFSNGLAYIDIETDNSGNATDELFSGENTGPVLITAEVDDTDVSVSSYLLTVQTALPDDLEIVVGTSGSSENVPDGMAQVKVSVIAVDSNGRPVATGTVVSLEILDALDNPPVSIGDNSSQLVTDDNGVATTVITYSLEDIGEELRVQATSGDQTETKDITLPGL